MRVILPTGLPTSLRMSVALHAILGIALLAVPGTLLGELLHQRVDRRVRAFARLLGARHLAEACILARRHTPGWALASAATDATHAGSMLALAAVRPQQRRLALTSAAAASALAALTIRDIPVVHATRTRVEPS